MIPKTYVYFLYSTIYALNIVISAHKLEYMNPFKWNDTVKEFIYQYKNCSIKDISYELLDADETQQSDDIPEFSPCNLSGRDILNIYKIVQMKDMNGESSKVTLSGCRALPNETEFNIVINKTVNCKDRIKGKCLLRFDKEIRILPGTEIQYKCKPDFFFFDPSNETTKTATCKDDLWLPQIESCRDRKNPQKHEIKWDKPKIWKPDLFITGCGNSTKKSPSNDESRVKVNSEHEFPWHVALYDNTSLYPICGASIISSEYLITAAHCFKDAFVGEKLHDEKLEKYHVMVGKINVRNDAKNRHRINIKRVFMSDYFRENLGRQNDIAIIWMDHKITYNESVLPICLINEYFPYIPKDEVPLMAAVSGGSSSRQENLMSVTTWFHSYQECINEKNVSPEKFCTKTKTGKRNLQPGDSGSGLVMKGPNDVYYLIGIVNYGWEDKDTVPTICTYVPLFHHWILETVYSNEIKPHGTHN